MDLKDKCMNARPDPNLAPIWLLSGRPGRLAEESGFAEENDSALTLREASKLIAHSS